MRVISDAVLRPVRRQKKVAARLPLPPPRRRPRGHHHPPVLGEEDEHEEEDEEDGDDDDVLLRKTSHRRRRRRGRRWRPEVGTAAGAAEAVEEIGTAAPAPALGASPRLWALLREAQEEMERGTDVLGDELNILWQNVREGAACCGREKEGTAAASAADSGGGVGGGGGVGNDRRGKGQRLPRREADVLLDGLEALQAEMEAEAISFQRQKSELTRKLRALPVVGGRDGRGEAEPGGVVVGERCGRRGKQDGTAGLVTELEEEAESMRTAVIASRARLLGRVREVRERQILSVTGVGGGGGQW